MKHVLFALGLLSVQTFASDFKSISIDQGVEVVDQGTNAPESVTVSDDGSKICWIAKRNDSKYSLPSEIFTKTGDEERHHVKKAGMLGAYTKCSFDKDNQLVAAKLHWRPLALTRTIVVGLMKGDFDPIGYVSSVTTLNDQEEAISVIKPKDLELNSNRIFIKHPRYSPDGKWLTYYLDTKNKKGVYVYHIDSKKVHKLSDVYDKHPTWTPDGKKILFHFQINATDSSVEQSTIGYFDLELSDKGEVLSSKRILLGDIEKDGFTYFKHPTLLPNSNLVVFHGKRAADEKSELFVRKLKPNSKIYRLKLKLGEYKVSKAKHPSIGAIHSDIYFIGKAKGAEDDSVLKINEEAVNIIKSEIN